jgi:single-stranded-DNA-specific exonuclease
MASFGKSIVRSKVPDAAHSLPESLHPVLRRAYAIRNLTRAEELDNGLGRMLPPSLLGGAEEAAGLLYRMLRDERRLLVVGDFDADGATSCALAVRALRAMGCQQVDYLVPNRFEYGYGLTPEIVEEAIRRSPDLILTVDNGISSIQGVARARSQGLEVLVTDHHLPGNLLPDASVIVNPNNRDDNFPSKNLAGVGVIFYVMAALRSLLRRKGWFVEQGIAEPNLAEYLDLVALGTVADVVPLDHNNRILVEQGLRRIRSGQTCAGIQALFEVAGRSLHAAVASDLGFAVGPRLNAAGRLDDMSIGIECLLTGHRGQALEYAAQLDSLNRERRQIETDMQRQAMAYLDELVLQDDDALPLGLCLYDKDWHQGVIGILAARVRERFHRPVIAFAAAEEEGMIKGSARSVPGLHIRDILDAVATRNPGLLSKFGGHAMAAGLTLDGEDFERFSREFNQELERLAIGDLLKGEVRSDGGLDREELSMELAELIRMAGPWGQSFPEPVFDDRFELASLRVVGEKHLKMVLKPKNSQLFLDAIAFNQVDAKPGEGCREIHAAYRLDINEFRGARNLQLMIEYFEAL